jgi:hypothetical protein
MSDLGNVEVTGIHSRTIATTTPNDKDLYQWNARTSQWEPHQPVAVQDDFHVLPDLSGSPLYPNLKWSLTGSSGLLALVSSETNHPGVCRLRSNTTGNSLATASLLSDGVPVANPYELVCVVKTPSSFPSDALLLIGNFDSLGGSTMVGFRYDKSQDSQWVSLTGNFAGTNTNNNISTIATSTWYKFKIRFDGTNYNFSVNDGTEIQHTTNLPATALNWFAFYTKSASTFDSFIDYYGLYFTSLSR